VLICIFCVVFVHVIYIRCGYRIRHSLVDDIDSHKKELSDQNRPIRVAEKMSDLYDNQWTDAFDELEQQMEDVDIIRNLLQIFTVRA